MDIEVIVIGSINADLITEVRRRPAGGETVLAVGLKNRPGGKGANQAAAAARAGASTALLGAVGEDPLGAAQLHALAAAGVDVTRVSTVPGADTGMAFITVTPDGENTIVVAGGANTLLDADTVRRRLAGTSAAIAVLQTEIAAAAVDSAAAWAQDNGIRVVLNNGPCADLTAETLAVADPLIVNEHEAAELCRPAKPSDDSLAFDVLKTTGARSVLVTLGGNGVQLATADTLASLSAVPVEVVDTTGAGDAFVGTVAARLAKGETLETAAHTATRAAAEAVTWNGARPPTTPLRVTNVGEATTC
ncbi:PfkB family carbohydrate kinase [Yinghuangia sp. YIM S10712]|uniref:PfkB family carbohydrate kinase n=1 Tax=Yinghuangia sp. YIM S10712 TaxID=3436930 RepID=UPI003F533CF7